MKTKYSLSRALRIADGDERGGLEAEVDQELSKGTHAAVSAARRPSVLVPVSEVFGRAQTAGVGSEGGFATLPETIPTVKESLRAYSVVVAAGAQVATLAANAKVPMVSTGLTCYWLGEIEEAPESGLTFGAANYSPRRCSGWLRASIQWLAQAAPVADLILSRELGGSVGSAFDLAALSGTGGSEPLGLFENPNLSSFTFGGAATAADLTGAESTLGTANGDDRNAVWISSPATRAKWRGIERASGNGGFLWNDDDRVLGKPAFSTANASGDKVVIGDFADLLIVLFGALSISTDEYTDKKTGQTRFHVDLMADVVPTRPGSFVISSDSAAQ